MRRRLAVFWLALILCFPALAGLGQAQDSSQPPNIPLLTQRAQKGDPRAMMALGEAYLDGNGVERDLEMAIRLFTPLARRNDPAALYLLSFTLRTREKPGDLEEALRYGVTALSLVKRDENLDFLQANIQSQLGFTYERLHRYGEAIIAYEAARSIFERKLGQHHPQVVGAYMNLANGLAGAGRQEEALAATDKALQILEKLPGDYGDLIASLNKNKASSFQALARYSEALEALDKAQSHYMKWSRAADLGPILSDRSRIYNLLRRNEEALTTAQSALALYEKASPQDHRILASIHNNLGLAYQGLGRYDEARAEYNTTAKIVEDNYGPQFPDSIYPLTNLGNVDDDQRKYESALTNYQKAFDIIRATYGPDHPETAAMLGRLGNTSRKLKRYDAALNFGLQALLIQSRVATVDVDNERYTFRLLARTLKEVGDRTTAIYFAKLAVNAHQTVRARNSSLSDEMRTSLGESFQSSYYLLSELLLADGQFSEAQFVSGLLKRQEFYEFTRGRSPADQDVEPEDIRLSDAELAFKTDIEASMVPVLSIGTQIQALAAAKGATNVDAFADQKQWQELNEQRNQAVQSYLVSARNLIERTQSQQSQRQKAPSSFGQQFNEKIQTDLRSMGPDTVLLQVTSLEDDLNLSVTAAGGETVSRRIPVSRPNLVSKVFAAVSAVKNHDDDAPTQLAGLYDLLIKPVRAELDAAVTRGGAHTPVLLLDLSGFLRYVPYAALYDGKRYLVEDFALALYNPASTTKFAAMPRGRIKGVGFGVTQEHQGFVALPGVGRELDAVTKIIGGKPRLDNAFTEKSLAGALATEPQILHIASHFRFRPGNESNSYLLLGNGDSLSLEQLRTQKQYDLQGIDLITLSACETALGGGAEGEEIESFGMLAQAKGASAVMSTLWQIADESTAQLMTDFYEGLVHQGLDKAHALQQAQVAMIRGETAQTVALQSSRSMSAVEDTGTDPQAKSPTSHPYYWAAFILMGNWM